MLPGEPFVSIYLQHSLFPSSVERCGDLRTELIVSILDVQEPSKRPSTNKTSPIQRSAPTWRNGSRSDGSANRKTSPGQLFSYSATWRSMVRAFFRLYLRNFLESDLFLVNWCCSDGGVAIGGRRCLCKFAVMEEVYNERSDLPCNRQSILQEGDHHTCLPHSPGAMERSELDSHVLQLGRELGIFVQLFQLFSESAQSPLEYARAKGYFPSCVSCTRMSTIKATLKSWLFIKGEKSDSRKWC